MMKINHFAGMVALTVFLAGCSASASGTKFKDSSFVTQRVVDDKGRVIFYREADTNFRWVTLGIDRSIVGALAQSGFIVADIAPGDHRLSAWLRYMPGEFAIRLMVSAGETYYIRRLAGPSACFTQPSVASAELFF